MAELHGDTLEATRQQLSANIGASRAARGVHPGESLRAAGVLFEVVVRRVACLNPAGVVDLTLRFNDVMIRALGLAAEAFAGLLLERIHRAHLEERRRIGRDLHDRIGHGINLAFRSLELYDAYRIEQPARGLARVEMARDALRETHEDLRQIISDMRVSEPVESLEKAVRTFLESAVGTDLDTQVEVNGDESWAPPHIRDESYLIIREALRNLIAHACAVHALVRIDVAPTDLRATVTDDGVGFDPCRKRPGHAGLISMRERAELLGGTLTVSSRPRRGTRVQLWVPLPGGPEKGFG